jgi:hypothetical protein
VSELLVKLDGSNFLCNRLKFALSHFRTRRESIHGGSATASMLSTVLKWGKENSDLFQDVDRIYGVSAEGSKKIQARCKQVAASRLGQIIH